MSTKKVQNTHIDLELRDFHSALLEIVGVMNSPQRDEAMVREAGISLDRALFPLLVLVDRLGPIGIVELADRVGRDYTTVSRQIAKLEELLLIGRQAGSKDRRVREAFITKKGKLMTDRVDQARARIAKLIFADWDEQDIVSLVRLTRRVSDDIKRAVSTEPTQGPLEPNG